MRVPSEGKEGPGQEIGIWRLGVDALIKIEIRPLLGIRFLISFLLFLVNTAVIFLLRED